MLSWKWICHVHPLSTGPSTPLHSGSYESCSSFPYSLGKESRKPMPAVFGGAISHDWTRRFCLTPARCQRVVPQVTKSHVTLPSHTRTTTSLSSLRLFCADAPRDCITPNAHSCPIILLRSHLSVHPFTVVVTTIYVKHAVNLSIDDTELVVCRCQKVLTVNFQQPPLGVPMGFQSFIWGRWVGPCFPIRTASADGAFDAAHPGTPRDAATVGNPSRPCFPG